MATLYGVQYNEAFVAVPITKVPPGEINGEVRTLIFDYVIPGTAPALNDIIKLGKIPKGARIIDAEIAFPDLGTVGVIELGWAASADIDTAGVAIEAASASGLLAAVDVHTAAAIVNMADVAGAYVAGYSKRFLAECDLQIKVSTAWDAVAGANITGFIQFVQA